MDNLIFDDQKMIIKDSSGKEFIADVSPQPNQSSGYINQCQVAARMVECYNAMKSEYDPADVVIQRKNQLELTLDRVKNDNLDFEKRLRAVKEKLEQADDQIDDLESKNFQLNEKNCDLGEQIETIGKELENIRKELNKRNLKVSNVRAMVAEMTKKHFGYDFTMSA